MVIRQSEIKKPLRLPETNQVSWVIPGSLDLHKARIGEIMNSLDRIHNPQTETDYFENLNFLLLLATHISTAEYRTWWAGIIEIWTKVDFNKVDTTMIKILKPLNSAIQNICNLFNVEHPTSKEIHGDRRSFREWYEANNEKLWTSKSYPAHIFEKLLSISLSSNPE